MKKSLYLFALFTLTLSAQNATEQFDYESYYHQQRIEILKKANEGTKPEGERKQHMRNMSECLSMATTKEAHRACKKKFSHKRQNKI